MTICGCRMLQGSAIDSTDICTWVVHHLSRPDLLLQHHAIKL